ncbi:hypothetical protein Glove_216g46 [Diversispora epigaea]|uniref:Uncharacterized protein n=1 Tax=Diversispora epigaea TaxID=1348612 RepID=A0A397IRJ0_9GLOM|nr:hypothetical protein Glove_216g46 [Diversispora epigaea]
MATITTIITNDSLTLGQLKKLIKQFPNKQKKLYWLCYLCDCDAVAVAVVEESLISFSHGYIMDIYDKKAKTAKVIQDFLLKLKNALNDGKCLLQLGCPGR